MDFDLVGNYDVTNIINFLNNNPQLWDKDPEPNKVDVPRCKSLMNSDSPELWLFIDPIAEDLARRFGGRITQHSLTLLPAHDAIRGHSDNDVTGLRRFHVPIQTNQNVRFYCGNSQINMKVGQCWEFDYKKWHRVVNDGDTDRIHLLVDLSKD